MKSEKNTTSTETKKSFYKRIPKLVFVVLSVLLLALSLFLGISKKIEQMKMNTELSNFKESYKMILDSTNTYSKAETVKVFSWVVRTELLDENIKEVNQLFNQYVKFKHIQKLMLLDPETSLIKLSTDKKLEGETLLEKDYNIKIDAITELEMTEDSTRINIFTPIMNLNKREAILIVEISK